MADEKPIIIIKKKGGHGGHHGGAWKVAYADFVTAMMAFFMVMWLVNTAEVATKKSIASYFRRPGIFSQGSGTPLEVGGAGMLEDAYSPSKPEGQAGTGRRDALIKTGTPAPTPRFKFTPAKRDETKEYNESPFRLTPIAVPENKGSGAGSGSATSPEAMATAAALGAQAAAEQRSFEEVAREIKQQFEGSEALAKLLGIVKVNVDADGLVIDIIDTEKTSMFESGSAAVLGEAREAFTKLGEVLKPLKNKIDILGHTDAKPFSSRHNGYTNWELSTDRANSARKILEAAGVETTRISSVVGRADRELLKPDNPTAASNRRITLKMRFDVKPRRRAPVDLSEDGYRVHTEGGAPPAPEPQVAPPPPIEGLPVSEETIGDEDDNTLAVAPTPPLVYKPKKIIQAAKAAEEKVDLPEEGVTPAPVGVGTPSGPFSDNPVVGPTDPFANF